MTLHTIAGSRNTEEFKQIERAIEFRAGGASIFAHDIQEPYTGLKNDAPKL